MNKPILPALLAAVALVAAACSSGGTKSAGGAPTVSPSASSGGPAIVAVAATPLGTILVDGAGRTLYRFVADTGASSTCYAACAATWPPLLTHGAPTAKLGATASDLGTTTRTDGTTEVTYAGHPLYYYVADTKPGAITGQGLNQFGGLWYVLSPKGTAITTAPPSA